MAINLDERYPGRANGKTSDYPQGSFKNRTSPSSKDGTYLEKDWANDQLAFFQSLIADAGLTPNNLVDTVQASQYFDALMMAVGNRFPKFATFAEIVALTQDEGPIICTDMGCGFYVWTTSAYFTGYRSVRCGEWLDGWTPNPLSWQLEARGGVWSMSDEKEKRVIARYRESGLVVPIGDWIPRQNMIADLGGGDFKAPDLRDTYKRMNGTDIDTANARGLGTYQGDAIRNIIGTLGMYKGIEEPKASGAFEANFSNVSTAGHIDNNSPMRSEGSWSFDASRVIPTSSENRTVNTTVSPFIHV